ncbi:cysteine hydrolase [Novosphingobium profundi]|uniref:cysteine hydrolase family protein n=1 Tax=Novosphingobium profundi TaxID=1774954 RepID=UPI001BDAE8DB|nr:isochorismatase family cysteine hydrolase [Novosphingobium profundi]MBT0667476.1 cysteine hydrolase [Novosphingobium profundi]
MPEVAELPHVAAQALAGMIDPATTALVVVDIQVDFAAPQGLAATFCDDLAPIEAVIDRIEELIAAAREAGMTLAFMRVVTRPETDSAALKTLMERRGMPGGEAICRAEGGGADYYRIAPEPGDIEIEKRLFDSFHETDFDAQLRARGIDTLLMTGITTECCVDSTARTAFHKGYNVFLLSDACAAYEPHLHTGTLEVLSQNIGLLATSAAVLEVLS